eukprot:5271950-Alexandrium_andersonii.AAC.1
MKASEAPPGQPGLRHPRRIRATAGARALLAGGVGHVEGDLLRARPIGLEVERRPRAHIQAL